MVISSSDVAADKAAVSHTSNAVRFRQQLVSVRTCQAEGFQAELGAVENDETVGLVQARCRVLHIALKVPGLLSRTDLLNLSNVNWRDRQRNMTR